MPQCPNAGPCACTNQACREHQDHQDCGAVGLATLLVLCAALITAMLTLVAAVDAVATMQRGQHAADILAIAAMERSPLAGGAGTVDDLALRQLAKTQGVHLHAVDTASWPLEVGIQVRAGPVTLLKGLWAGPILTARAEVIPPTDTAGAGALP